MTSQDVKLFFSMHTRRSGSGDKLALTTGSLDSLLGLAGEFLCVDDTGGSGKGTRSEHLEVAGFDDVNYSSVGRGGSLASGLRN